MKQMTVVTDDKVGVLADISYILGKAKINIDSVVAVSMEGKAIVSLFLKDEKRAAELLKANGYRILESEILVVKLRDQPGELSKISSLLTAQKVNIVNLYIVAKEKGNTLVALRTDKPAKAKKLLAPYMNMED